MNRKGSDRPRYDAALIANLTLDEAAVIRAWADVREVTVSALMREIVAAGVEALEPGWRAEARGDLDPKFLASVKARTYRRVEKKVINQAG